MSADGIRENPILTKYINAMANEEDKMTDSIRREHDINAELQGLVTTQGALMRQLKDFVRSRCFVASLDG